MDFSFSKDELMDIVWSTLAIGFIFSYDNFSLALFAMMTLVVALSFIPHEMAHKLVAQKYGCFARYEMWKTGLMFAVAMTVLFDFALIAPGAVVIYPLVRDRSGAVRHVRIGPRENALISAAGPLTNIMIALFFLPLMSVNALFWTVVYINSFLAVFNMIPVPPLDGSKIIWYNILLWLVMLGAGIFLVSVSGVF